MEAEVVATFLGVAVASFALIFTAIQVSLNRKQVSLNTEQLRLNLEVNRGNFWLKLEEMSRYYDDIHLKLRPGGDWVGKDEEGKYKGPKKAAEWASVEDYMGFFEHLKIMYDRQLIDKLTFKKIFAYRLRNIVGNPIIVDEKLRQRGEYWEDFIQLLKILEIGSVWYDITPRCLDFHLPGHLPGT